MLKYYVFTRVITRICKKQFIYCLKSLAVRIIPKILNKNISLILTTDSAVRSALNLL